MIPFVDVVYDGDDYEFEISLEPKDPCCFGFKVVYHNGSFLLLQNIESIDISCVPGMEYIENDEELYDSIEFFHIPFFHVQIYQRKELCQWIFHGSCYLSCWVRLQIQSVMFSAVQRKIKLR